MDRLDIGEAGVIFGVVLAGVGIWLAVLSSMHDLGWRHQLQRVAVSAAGVVVIVVSSYLVIAPLGCGNTFDC